MKPSRAKRKIYRKQVRETELKLLNSQMDYNNEHRARVMAEGLGKELYARIREYEETFNDAVAVFGRDHPLFKPTLLQLGGRWLEYVDVPDRNFERDFSPKLPVQMASILVRRLSVLATDVMVREWNHDVHVQVKFAHGPAAYALTQESLGRLPKPILFRRIAEELTRQLLNDKRRAA